MNTDRLFFSTALAASSLALAAPLQAAAQPAPRPNILFICLDDWNGLMECARTPDLKTPNIARLAQSGITFTRAYAQNPVCHPSRASFLSGYKPDRTGIFSFSTHLSDAMPDVKFLPRWFRENGYFTARVDKIFHIGEDIAACWDVSEDYFFEKAKRPNAELIVRTPYELDYYELGHLKDEVFTAKGVVGENGAQLPVDIADADTLDVRTARRCVELISEGVASGKPFFVAAGLRRPHLPWYLPKHWWENYDPAKLDLPSRVYSDGFVSTLDDSDWRKYVAGYYTAMTYVDAQVGLLLDALDKSGVAENTLIVLLGDNGYCLGEKNDFFSKSVPMERANRVGLIMAGYGITRRGVEDSHIVQLLDLYPTLVQLARLPHPPESLDGTSLAPIIADPAAPWKDIAISTGTTGKQRWYSVRDSRYRYSEMPTGTPLSLYDLDADPSEAHNLLDDPSHADTCARLRSLLLP